MWEYSPNDDDNLFNRILSWTKVSQDSGQILKWIDATESTANAHKEAVIDDLLGETPIPGAVRVTTNRKENS